MSEPQPVPELDDLVDHVEARANDRSALVALETAITIAEVVADRSDQLIHHYVQGARDSGHSWTEIGAVLGVSKQAARQRFSATIGQVGDLMPTTRLQACLEAGQQEAAAAGEELSTLYQLIGLFVQGVAAAILTRSGVTRAGLEAAAVEFESRDDLTHPDAALDRAATIARRAGHTYLGTEHLLAALVLDVDSDARRLLKAAGADLALIEQELDCAVPAKRRRRRRRAETRSSCAFCGKHRRDDVRLVAGPGVCICEECVALASDVLAGC